MLDEAMLEDFVGRAHHCQEQIEGDHGRIETRRVGVCWEVKLLGPLGQQWPGLGILAVVESLREVDDHRSVERHYYTSSLDKRTKAKRMGAEPAPAAE